MKKVLVVSNNESIISLFAEYSALQGAKIKVVNEEPAKPFKTIKEAVEIIMKTDFDVLVIGHKLGDINFELLYSGLAKSEDGEGITVLELAKDILKDKVVISDGCTPTSYPQVMMLYRNIGVRHFINRQAVYFADRFNNLMLCLDNKCNCDSL